MQETTQSWLERMHREAMEVKFAGYVGNKHLRIRTTAFFDRPDAVQGNFDWVAECGNWQEHQRWNAQRVGNYAACPVQE